MNKHLCPDGYTQITDVRTIQKLILRLMVQFHDICEKHHLIYNLCGGTLLGAVRHKGFIPWDDDLDVSMPRDDYEKFIEIAKSEYEDEFITLAPGDKNYIYPFAKICMKDTALYERGIIDKYKIGLYLDIFPFDGYPGDDIVAKDCIVKKLKRIWSLENYSVLPMDISITWWKKFLYPVKAIVFALFRVIGPEKFVDKYTKIVTSYRFEDCEYVLGWWCYYEKNRIAKIKFLDRVLYDFESYKFWSVRDYDDWLTRTYGDYMTPPPPEKCVQYHGFELFVKKEILESL